jgi:hypothetical protein
MVLRVLVRLGRCLRLTVAISEAQNATGDLGLEIGWPRAQCALQRFFVEVVTFEENSGAGVA